MLHRSLLLCVAAVALATGCASHSAATVQAPTGPGQLAWVDSVRDFECPQGTSAWVMNARRLVQPVSRPPDAVYQRGPAGEMYTLQCQPGYRCLVRPVAAWCQRSDGTEHGPYLEWYEDDRTIRAVGGDFIDGKEHGRWTHWDRDGRVELIQVYHNGKMVQSVSSRDAGSAAASAR